MGKRSVDWGEDLRVGRGVGYRVEPSARGTWWRLVEQDQSRVLAQWAHQSLHVPICGHV